MIKFLMSLFIVLVISPICWADDLFYPSNYTPSDPELANLQWNRYTTPNFVILSIDDQQGKWLADNLEIIKTWCITRWGFPDFKFSKECRIMCVPNRTIMKKLFNLTEPSYEIRQKDGKLEISVMWLILDNKPNMILPAELTAVCLAEFQAQHNVKFGHYVHRGMSLLNLPSQEIRQKLANLGMGVAQGEILFPSEKMFLTTEEEYIKLGKDDKRMFDQQSVALCLMLRKEFGEAKMQGFFRLGARNKPEEVLNLVYGFRDFAQFDKSYARYMRDLTNDVLKNKTPNSYLEIKPINK